MVRSSSEVPVFWIGWVDRYSLSSHVRFVSTLNNRSVACAKGFPQSYGHNDEFTAATMVIVLFTIVVMGGCLEMLLDFLNIQTGTDFEEYMKDWHRRRRLVGRFHRFGTTLRFPLPLNNNTSLLNAHVCRSYSSAYRAPVYLPDSCPRPH
jgi:hypothetical protein